MKTNRHSGDPGEDRPKKPGVELPVPERRKSLRLAMYLVAGFLLMVALAIYFDRAWRPARPATPPQDASGQTALPATVASPPGQQADRGIPVGAAYPKTAVAAQEPKADSQAVAQIVKQLKDPQIPIADRRRELAALAARADPQAVAALQALGREDTYLNDAAVAALGGLHRSDLALYLKERTQDANPRVVAAAVTSLGQTMGGAGVEAIAATVKSNRQRPDGFENLVCAACVEALVSTKSESAIPVLGSEMAETVGKELNEDYGSQIVAAFVSLGYAAAIPHLESYRARLEIKFAHAAEDPMVGRYYQDKLNEVNAAMSKLGTR